MNSGRILVSGSNFYCGSSTSNLCQLARLDQVPAQYVHPATKVCNYIYTHPSTKQCTWTPDLSSVSKELDTLTKVHTVTGSAVSKRVDEYAGDADGFLSTVDLSSYFKIRRNCRICVEHTAYTVNLSCPYIGKIDQRNAWSVHTAYSSAMILKTSNSGGRGTYGPKTITYSIPKTYIYYDIKYFPYNGKYLIRTVFSELLSNSNSAEFSIGSSDYVELTNSYTNVQLGAACAYYGSNNPAATSSASVASGSITLNIYRSA